MAIQRGVCAQKEGAITYAHYDSYFKNSIKIQSDFSSSSYTYQYNSLLKISSGWFSKVKTFPLVLKRYTVVTFVMLFPPFACSKKWNNYWYYLARLVPELIYITIMKTIKDMRPKLLLQTKARLSSMMRNTFR